MYQHLFLPMLHVVDFPSILQFRMLQSSDHSCLREMYHWRTSAFTLSFMASEIWLGLKNVGKVAESRVRSPPSKRLQNTGGPLGWRNLKHMSFSGVNKLNELAKTLCPCVLKNNNVADILLCFLNISQCSEKNVKIIVLLSIFESCASCFSKKSVF